MVFTAPDGTKIGVFGLDTPETATKAHPAKIQGVTFLAGDKMFDCAQDQVDALEAEGCEYIICLGHLGIDAESTGNRSIDLLEKVEGIDVFIDGHSHSTLEDVKAAAGGTGKVGDTLVTSTGTKLESVGVVTIDADGTITTATTPVADLTATDADVAARAAKIQAEIDKEYGTVFAKTEVALNGEKEPGNRTEETNLGDLICDALVWGAEREGTEVDAAVTNGGLRILTNRTANKKHSSFSINDFRISCPLLVQVKNQLYRLRFPRNNNILAGGFIHRIPQRRQPPGQACRGRYHPEKRRPGRG